MFLNWFVTGFDNNSSDLTQLKRRYGIVEFNVPLDTL